MLMLGNISFLPKRKHNFFSIWSQYRDDNIAMIKQQAKKVETQRRIFKLKMLHVGRFRLMSAPVYS